MTSEDVDRFRALRHDLANPLSALLAETQLLLMRDASLDAETANAVRDIDALAKRMRAILRES